MLKKYIKYSIALSFAILSFIYINNWWLAPIHYDIEGNSWVACLVDDSLLVTPMYSNSSFKNSFSNCFIFSEEHNLIMNRIDPFFNDFEKKKVDVIVYCGDNEKYKNVKDSLNSMTECLKQMSRQLCFGYEFDIKIAKDLYSDPINYHVDEQTFFLNNHNLTKKVEHNSIVLVYTSLIKPSGLNGHAFRKSENSGVAIVKAFDPILILHEMLHVLDKDTTNVSLHDSIANNDCYEYVTSTNYKGCNFAFKPSKLPRLHVFNEELITFNGNETFLLPSSLKPDTCICDRLNDLLNVFHVDTTTVIEFASKSMNDEKFRIELILAMNSIYPNLEKFKSNSEQTYNHLFLPAYEKYGFWGNAASSDDDKNNVSKEQFIDITTKGILELRKANATLILRHLLPNGFKTPTDQLVSAYLKMINKKFTLTLNSPNGKFTDSLFLGTNFSNFAGSRLSVELRYDGTILVTNLENEILFNRNIGFSNLKAIDVKTYCHFTEYQIKLSVNALDEVLADNLRITPIKNPLKLNKIPNSLRIRYKNNTEVYPIDNEKFYKIDECTFSYHKTITVTDPNYSLAFDNATSSRIENLKITNKDIQGNTNKFTIFRWPTGKIKTTFEISYSLKGRTKMDTTLLTLEQKDFNNVMKYNVKLNLPTTFDYRIVWEVKDKKLISLTVDGQDITRKMEFNLAYDHKKDVSINYCYNTNLDNRKICKTILVPIKDFVQLDNNNYLTYKIISVE